MEKIGFNTCIICLIFQQSTNSTTLRVVQSPIKHMIHRTGIWDIVHNIPKTHLHTENQWLHFQFIHPQTIGHATYFEYNIWYYSKKSVCCWIWLLFLYWKCPPFPFFHSPRRCVVPFAVACCVYVFWPILVVIGATFTFLPPQNSQQLEFPFQPDFICTMWPVHRSARNSVHLFIFITFNNVVTITFLPLSIFFVFRSHGMLNMVFWRVFTNNCG